MNILVKMSKLSKLIKEYHNELEGKIKGEKRIIVSKSPIRGKDYLCINGILGSCPKKIKKSYENIINCDVTGDKIGNLCDENKEYVIGFVSIRGKKEEMNDNYFYYNSIKEAIENYNKNNYKI